MDLRKIYPPPPNETRSPLLKTADPNTPAPLPKFKRENILVLENRREGAFEFLF